MKNNLKVILADKGIIVTKMHEDTGLAMTTLSNFQRSKTQIKTDTLVKISEYLNVSTDIILGLEPYTTLKQK